MQGILLKQEEVKKLNKKLDYCLQTEKLVTVLEAEKKELITQKDLQEQKITNLNLNVDEYKRETSEYKKAYIDKNEQLNKLQESVPSRAVWMGIGAGTTAILGILLMFLVTK